ncbi:HugZ family protein [Thiomicrorhabdus sediminis]|uniref:HugZ family protein n=1 Tax=Thiomicrorhabdus sediminis TaxID=2580412 RepID=A0A4P9K6X7_9GAMM|nr:HugZ family protein [Thiomicrorhabdus sediminis]QCU90854.1 HugZ family protein [Thiomicrorhabdus sediminis]
MSETAPQQSCRELIANSKTLMLSTLQSSFWRQSKVNQATAVPVLHSSVTPFIYRDNAFFIFISELAQHTANLQALIEYNALHQQEPAVLISILLSCDEAETTQLFARQRLSMQCEVGKVDSQSKIYQPILAQFTEEFGEVVDILKTLDFHLFKLQCISGDYVQGFGQAYRFQGLPCDKLEQKRQ